MHYGVRPWEMERYTLSEVADMRERLRVLQKHA